jgi:hypothetical protein
MMTSLALRLRGEVPVNGSRFDPSVGFRVGLETFQSGSNSFLIVASYCSPDPRAPH